MFSYDSVGLYFLDLISHEFNKCSEPIFQEFWVQRFRVLGSEVLAADYWFQAAAACDELLSA
jgi:hypothetical protein